MLLAINANNTNVKFALIDGDGTINGQWRISTDPARTSDEYAVWLDHLMAHRGFSRDTVTACAIASVVPRTIFELKSLSRQHFGCEPMLIGEPGVNLGIQVLIDRPQEAGADRLLNAIAGHRDYGGPLIVVDFGTGTTLDIVDADGNYVGGIIAPGINLSVDALYAAAAQLPRIAVEKPSRVIGTNTVEAMKSGVYWGYVGLIEGLVARVRAEFEAPDMPVVATGGLAPLFADATDVFRTVDPDLTLKGLCIVHKANSGAGA